jgi:ribosomal protein S18
MIDQVADDHPSPNLQCLSFLLPLRQLAHSHFAASFGRDNLPWKRIVESTVSHSRLSCTPTVTHAPSQHIRPHQLTYNARLKKVHPGTKRQTIGPGSPESRWNDAFHQLGLDPLVECQNSDLLASFLSEMGKIHGREKTGLTTRTQRRLAKAIRRAKHMGIIPLHSRPQTDSMRTVGAPYFA